MQNEEDPAEDRLSDQEEGTSQQPADRKKRPSLSLRTSFRNLRLTSKPRKSSGLSGSASASKSMSDLVYRPAEDIQTDRMPLLPPVPLLPTWTTSQTQDAPPMSPGSPQSSTVRSPLLLQTAGLTALQKLNEDLVNGRRNRIGVGWPTSTLNRYIDNFQSEIQRLDAQISAQGESPAIDLIENKRLFENILKHLNAENTRRERLEPSQQSPISPTRSIFTFRTRTQSSGARPEFDQDAMQIIESFLRSQGQLQGYNLDGYLPTADELEQMRVTRRKTNPALRMVDFLEELPATASTEEIEEFISSKARLKDIEPTETGAGMVVKILPDSILLFIQTPNTETPSFLKRVPHSRIVGDIALEKNVSFCSVVTLDLITQLRSLHESADIDDIFDLHLNKVEVREANDKESGVGAALKELRHSVLIQKNTALPSAKIDVVNVHREQIGHAVRVGDQVSFHSALQHAIDTLHSLPESASTNDVQNSFPEGITVGNLGERETGKGTVVKVLQSSVVLLQPNERDEFEGVRRFIDVPKERIIGNHNIGKDVLFFSALTAKIIGVLDDVKRESSIDNIRSRFSDRVDFTEIGENEAGTGIAVKELQDSVFLQVSSKDPAKAVRLINVPRRQIKDKKIREGQESPIGKPVSFASAQEVRIITSLNVKKALSEEALRTFGEAIDARKDLERREQTLPKVCQEMKAAIHAIATSHEDESEELNKLWGLVEHLEEAMQGRDRFERVKRIIVDWTDISTQSKQNSTIQDTSMQGLANSLPLAIDFGRTISGHAKAVLAAAKAFCDVPTKMDLLHKDETSADRAMALLQLYNTDEGHEQFRDLLKISQQRPLDSTVVLEIAKYAKQNIDYSKLTVLKEKSIAKLIADDTLLAGVLDAYQNSNKEGLKADPLRAKTALAFYFDRTHKPHQELAAWTEGKMTQLMQRNINGMIASTRANAGNHFEWMISQQTLPCVKLSGRTFTGALSTARTNAGKESGQAIQDHEYSGQVFQGKVHRVEAPDGELQWVYINQTGISGTVVHRLDASKVRFTDKEGNPVPIEQDKYYTFALPKKLEVMPEEGLHKHCEIVPFNDYIADRPGDFEFKGTVRHIANGKGVEKKGTMYVRAIA